MSSYTLEKPQRVLVPVTTYEEFTMPSKKERDELIASLEEGRAQIARGEFTRHTKESLKALMMDAYHGKTKST